MLTDWILVRRLAAELDLLLRGRRITRAGELGEGRFGLRCGGRGGEITVVFAPFAASPFASAEPDGHAPDPAPGFARSVHDALKGLTVGAVRARFGDRLVAIDLRARSRFGVETGYRFVAELVPRFGNLLLLKGETTVAALKSFEGAPGARRIKAGDSYEPPPLPRAAGDLAGFIAQLEQAACGDPAVRAETEARLFHAYRPSISRPLAASFACTAASHSDHLAEPAGSGAVPAGPGAARAAQFAAWAQGIEETCGTDTASPVYVYRDAGKLVQCHVTRLAQCAHLTESLSPSLLGLAGEILAGRDAGHSPLDAYRTRLRAQLRRRLSELESEEQIIARELAHTEGRELLAATASMLYAYAGRVTPGASSFTPPLAGAAPIALDPLFDAKANAARMIKRYRKLGAAIPHLTQRAAAVADRIAYLRELDWHLDDADGAAMDDVAREIPAPKNARQGRTGLKAAARKAPETIAAGAGAQLYVGRSPRQNDDVTFRLARPADLWFHARGVPGAHVVLHIDANRAAGVHEIELAARYAAAFSRAKDAPSVDVDYTERKYVRKRGAPGLVWYTNARTIRVPPVLVPPDTAPE